MRRKRRQVEAGEYSDPLKDYSPTEYGDGLEKCLCEMQIKQMQTTPLVQVTPGTKIRVAMEKMAELGIASVLVTQAGKLVGIFTERDVLDKVAPRFAELADKPVSSVMTTGVVVAYETDTVAKALNLMAIGGFRHIPVLDVDDNVVGVLGPRRITKFLEQHFPD